MFARTLLQRLLSVLALSMLAVTGALAQARIDPALTGVFAGLPAGGQAEVIVTFHGDQAPTAADLQALQQAGVLGGVTFRSLPMVGTLATLEQVNALASNPRVRSVFHNQQLEYHNYDARHMTGVERLRGNAELTRLNRGLPVSGRGIGVVINDSGVDGTHPDHQLGKNLVQNVWAPITRDQLSATGYRPFIALENQPNTDVGSGHGTHVAGTVGGTGQASGGKHAGVAPGANLVGVGSGAVVLVLNTLAGFDYAATNQFLYNIRVVTNSWGSYGEFDPDNPVNVATRILTDKHNIVVLFSAGNRGGVNTHSPYGKAPWVISVANGVKNGRLAPSSSRGTRGGHWRTARSSSGEEIRYLDEPVVTAPGTSIVSTRSSTGTLGTVVDPFYVSMSGTSMSTPHVAGIVALMLEANPVLNPYEVQQILRETATRMPGYHGYEVGAGFVNAFAAVQKAFDLSTAFGKPLQERGAVTGATEAILLQESYDHNPASTTPYLFPFNVPAAGGILEVRIDYNGLDAVVENLDNPLYLELVDPNGVTYSSYQLYFALYQMKNLAIVVNNPIPGTWRARVEMIPARGNAATFPDRVTVTSKLMSFHTPALADVGASHPAKGAIDFALTNGFLGLCGSNTFCPGQSLSRAQLARAFTQFGAIRQFLPLNGGSTFGDVSAADRPFVEAVAARGAALRDREFLYGGVMEGSGTAFNPGGAVNRAQMAKMMVRGVGGEATALAHTGNVTVLYNGQTYVIADQDLIPQALRGYVHTAINSNMLNVFWRIEQGPYDLTPVLKPYFQPGDNMTRADAAVAIARYYTQYFR